LKKIQDELDIVGELGLDGVQKTYGLVDTAIWKKKSGEECEVSYILMELIKGVELIDFINESK